jgi:hypothetical protein
VGRPRPGRGYHHPTLVASGEVGEEGASIRAEPEPLHRLLSITAAIDSPDEVQVLGGRDIAVHARSLGNDTGSPARLEVAGLPDLGTEKRDPPGGRLKGALEQADRRALAGAVRSEEAASRAIRH